MIRVLYIARYRTESMETKIHLLAEQPDISIQLVRPSRWTDEYGSVELPVKQGLPYPTIAVPMMGKNNDYHRALYRTLDFGMRAFRPHLIHAEEEPDSLAALQIATARRLFASGSRLILHTWQNVNRRKSWHVKLVLQTSFKLADCILCANQEATAVLRQMAYTGPTEVITPYGADLSVYGPPAAPDPQEYFTVLYVGRFAPEKGLDLLIKAFQRLNGLARLCLIGDGPLRHELETMAEALSLRQQVEFLRPMPPRDLVTRIQSASVLVLPSRGTPVWKEQFGRVLIEAMACKIPVIGSDSGAIPEVVGDGGLIFPENSADGLLSCLQTLMDSPNMRLELGEKGYKRVRSFYSQEIVASKTADFYRRISREWK